MHNSGRASRGTADGGAVMRAELQEGTVTLPTASARLAEAQGHGHTRPPRPVTREGQGRARESQCPGREPGWLCPPTVRAPSCCLATEDVFCQRCRDGIGWGTCFFFHVIHQLGSHQCCLATKSALAPGCPSPPTTGPQGTLGLQVGWYSMQGTEEGPKSAFSHPETSGAHSAFL